MKSGQWMFNFGNEENWCEDEYFDTKEKAIKVARAKAIAEVYYHSFQVGQIVYFKPSVDVENVLERISENAYDECGDCGEDYLSDIYNLGTDRLKELLNEALDRWIKETNNEPNFYKIENIEIIQSNLDWLEGL